MEKITLDKFNTLCNVGNSILKRFETPIFHDSFPPLDEILSSSKNKKVCLVLFDGFGKAIIEKHKELCPFIYSHIFKEFKSVYPCTTVAATTSLTTGKYPLETGYIGWTQHFNEYNDDINVFLSNSKTDWNKRCDKDIQNTLLKVDKIWELINKQNKYKATFLPSFLVEGENKEQLDNYFDETDKLLKEYDFLYSYCAEPDHTMHEYGTNDQVVKDMIIYLNNKLEEIVNKNKDVTFILVADHGMKDVEDYLLKEHKELVSSLKDPYTTIEPRFASLRVKDETKLKDFYNKELKDYFVLKSKEELLNEHTLGYGTPHHLLNEFLGDYFLLSKSKYLLNDGSSDFKFKGHHAGITSDETDLYMMIFNN